MDNETWSMKEEIVKPCTLFKCSNVVICWDVKIQAQYLSPIFVSCLPEHGLMPIFKCFSRSPWV